MSLSQPQPASPKEIQRNRFSPDQSSHKQRIEDKLIQGRKATLRKIEEMRRKQEEEAKRQSPGQPVISQKSAYLAEKAEERFFRRHSPGKGREMQAEHMEKSPAKHEIRPATRPLSQSQGLSSAPTSPPRASSLLHTALASSLYPLSSLQRNQLWLTRKSLKLAQQRESLVQSSLKECTFSPKIHSKPPQAIQNKTFSGEQNPFQLEDKFDRAVLRAVGRERGVTGLGETTETHKSLSPFKVTFGAFRPESFLENRKKSENAAVSKTTWQ